MDAKLLYIGYLQTNVEPVVQVMSGQKVIITSIRVSVPDNKTGLYEIHHVPKGQTATSTTNAIAYNVPMNSKEAAEFLTHPLPLSSGESLWVSGDGITMAIYGIVL